MTDLERLPSRGEDGAVHCVVETPRGSRAKFKYDPELGLFKLSKSLHAGLTYPYDWGFVPSTKAEDGDPIDIMVIHEAATFPGMLIACDLIGVLVVNDVEKGKKKRNDRLFAVPREPEGEGKLKDVRELPERLREELQAFFAATLAMVSKEVEPVGWLGPREAADLLAEATSKK